MPDNLVIVLDPGHGGSNEGLKHQGLVEKDINLVVANAMKDTLLQYEQVEVYITNPEKKDMSLKQRAEYAKSVGADIIISLHFNMSENHEFFGSEVWIPSTGLGYSKMHSLGDIFMEQFAEMGMTLRGVKTRLNDRGTDYYGIIRESATRNIPCILVEHGYADHHRDFERVNDEEDFKAMGVSDATAVAKYYGLKSNSLGTDYASYIKNGYFAPEEAVGSDLTEPVDIVICYKGEAEGSLYQKAAENGEEESFLKKQEAETQKTETQKTETQEVQTQELNPAELRNLQVFQIGAREEESNLVYYSYSIDGGSSWSELYPFTRDASQMEIVIPNLYAGCQVSVRIYNSYSIYGQSDFLSFQSMEEMLENGTITQKQVEDATYVVSDLPKEENEKTNIDEDRFKEELPAKEQGTEQQISETLPIAESRHSLVSPFQMKLVSALFLFFAVLLFLSSYLTGKALYKKYGKDKKRIRKLGIADKRSLIKAQRSFLLLGLICMLVGACGFALTYIKKVNITKNAIAISDAALETDIVHTQQSEDMADKDITISTVEIEKEPKTEIDLFKLPLVLTEEAETQQKKVMFYEKEEIAFTTIYDIAEGFIRVPLLEKVKKNPYDLEKFSGSNLTKTYQSDTINKPLVGIDVSKFQGKIDWEAVSRAGVQFAMLRVGLRGYGSGELVTDERFFENQQGAYENGIRTGVYFFSQAINEEEAVEEAKYVLDLLQGVSIDMPIVFDTEPIYYDDARTDHLTPAQLTNITKAFCDTIAGAGYQPMIYANAKRFTTVLFLEKLTDYPFWLADYRETPDYPYDFLMWQFTEKGQVEGIEGNVDMDLYFGQ